VITALRRLRGIALGIVALALSASLAFAGQPAGAAVGLANASTHAGRTVPVIAEDPATEPDAATDTDTETDQSDQTEQTDETDQTDQETSDSADNCTVDLTQDPSVLLTLNHGSVVCTAAQATTWDTTLYRNKGAWVSHWAKMNHGHDPNKPHGHSGG
jgi:hypothetical protein